VGQHKILCAQNKLPSSQPDIHPTTNNIIVTVIEFIVIRHTILQLDTDIVD